MPALSALVGLAVAAGGAFLAGGLGSAIAVAGSAIASYAVNQLLRENPQGTGAERQTASSMERSSDAPARWALGECRNGGLLAFYEEFTGEDIAFVDMAIALSEGACENIEGVWIDNVYYELFPFTRSVVTPMGPRQYSGLRGGSILHDGADFYPVEVYPALDADGTGGDFLRDATTWGDTDKLEGISWTHLRLIQHKVLVENNKAAWRRFPSRIAFRIKGIKVNVPADDEMLPPGSTEVEWTPNAAAIMRWWVVDMLGYPASDVDHVNWEAAYRTCAEQVQQSGRCYEGSPAEMRWRFDGLVFSDDSPLEVERRLNTAWRGSVTNSSGTIRFHPGGMPPSTVPELPASDILRPAQVQAAPALDQRGNVFLGSLAQDASSGDFLPQRLPAVRDEYAILRDGIEREVNAGVLSFVSHRTQAARVLADIARAARAPGVVVLHVAAGSQFEWVTIGAGTVIEVTEPTLGLNSTRMTVESVRIQPDWTVRLTCREDYRFSDAIQLEALTPRSWSPEGAALSIVSPLLLREPGKAHLEGDVVDATWRGRGGVPPYVIRFTGTPEYLQRDGPRLVGIATEPGPQTFDVSITDSAGTVVTKEERFLVDPASGAGVIAPTLASGSVRIGRTLTRTPIITGNDAPPQWAVDADPPPRRTDAVTVSQVDGTVTVAPTPGDWSAGTEVTITLYAIQARCISTSRQFSVEIRA